MSKVLKTIVNVILFCAIVVAAGLLIPPFAGITTVMVVQWLLNSYASNYKRQGRPKRMSLSFVILK